MLLGISRGCVPPGTVHEQHGVRAGCDRPGVCSRSVGPWPRSTARPGCAAFLATDDIGILIDVIDRKVARPAKRTGLEHVGNPQGNAASKSGGRTKPGSGRRTASFGNGRAAEPGPASRRISVTAAHICSAPSPGARRRRRSGASLRRYRGHAVPHRRDQPSRRPLLRMRASSRQEIDNYRGLPNVAPGIPGAGTLICEL